MLQERLMKQEEILSILSKNEISHYLNEMSQVHMFTKHYLLIAEEISEENVTFLQPLKEHRDAYDHLIRIFTLAIREGNEINAEQYILDNIKKAFGHEYRAFFDMADWFTYICRKYVREELSFNSKRKKYEENFDDFESVKEFINEVPYKIAKYREEKDVSNKESILSEVMDYKNTMDRLLDIYKRVQAL